LSCILAPYMMAFTDVETNTGGLFYLDSTINILFAIDMILRFFTAYIDDDSLELRDSKIVRQTYSYLKLLRKLQRSI
jgi:hypothetical protein